MADYNIEVYKRVRDDILKEIARSLHLLDDAREGISILQRLDYREANRERARLERFIQKERNHLQNLRRELEALAPSRPAPAAAGAPRSRRAGR